MTRRDTVEERWAPVRRISTYAVSTHGRVIHIRLNRELKLYKDSYGYYCVNLNWEGKLHRRRVHRLVAESFFTDEVFNREIFHYDGDKANNFYENLRYRNTDTSPVKPRRHLDPVVLTEFEIVETGQRYGSIRELAKKTGMDMSTIYKVLRGDREHHLGLSVRKVEV